MPAPDFSQALYIKLGENGAYEKDCIEKGLLKVSYREIPDALCQAGKWAEVAAKYREIKSSPGVATRLAQELKRFFEAGTETIWITFSGGKMWWSIADGSAWTDKEGYKYRTISAGWSCQDAKGKELDMQKLSGRLTKVSGYRGTICRVNDFGYLLDKINRLEIPDVAEARKNKAALLESLETLIRRLPWKDFELFVDLVFVSAGWRRISEVGKTMKGIDLDMSQPVTQERAYIQVKSAISQSELRKFADEANAKDDRYHRIYLVTHSANLRVPEDVDKRFKIFGVERLAKLALDAGLTDWLIEKSG
jgi:hypothetical protein